MWVVLVACGLPRAEGAPVGLQGRDSPQPPSPHATDDLDRELFGDDATKPQSAAAAKTEKTAAAESPKPAAPVKPGPSKSGPSKPDPAKPQAPSKPSPSKSSPSTAEKPPPSTAEKPLPSATERPKSSTAPPVESVEEAMGKTIDEMRDAGMRIGRADCGADTQQLQKRVAARLDALLQQARKRCSECQGQGQGQGKGQGSCNSGAAQAASGGASAPPTASKPGNAATKSARDANPKAKSPELGGKLTPQERLSLLKQLWGNLPDRQREMLLQLPSAEDFLPEYETLIEDYFRGLAEEGGTP